MQFVGTSTTAAKALHSAKEIVCITAIDNRNIHNIIKLYQTYAVKTRQVFVEARSKEPQMPSMRRHGYTSSLLIGSLIALIKKSLSSNLSTKHNGLTGFKGPYQYK